MRVLIAFAAGAAGILLASGIEAAPDTAFEAELATVQQAWAVANYEKSGDARERALESLEATVSDLAARNPNRAEALIWKGIVQSTHAGAKGGLGALSLAKKARGSLEAALALDPTSLDGSAYTSLGTLYYKVPGFPLGFGDRDKAEELLRKALEINPNGIDPNFFYGELQYERGNYAEALRSLEKASNATPRPGRELADRGRRGEIAVLTEKVRAKLHDPV
jgi:tetratricopeptide (TPR) repeat protein